MGFIDDEHRYLVFGVILQQQTVQASQALGFARRDFCNAEVHQGHFQKLIGGKGRVQNYARVDPRLGERPQDSGEESCLSRARIANQNRKTLTVQDGIRESGQRLPMLRRHEQQRRIRRHTERGFL